MLGALARQQSRAVGTLATPFKLGSATRTHSYSRLCASVVRSPCFYSRPTSSHRPALFFSAAFSSSSGDPATDPNNVLRTLHRVQEILGHTFEFSRVVMCGDQSSGKTSVLEALIGADISVKDNAMATRVRVLE